VSDRHLRILRQAAKAARDRLRTDTAADPAASPEQAAHRAGLVARAMRTTTQIRRAETRRGGPRRQRSRSATTPDEETRATPQAPALQRGSDGVLRAPRD
jgi:hypothetical protein